LVRERVAKVRGAGGSEELVQFVSELPTTASGRIELGAPELGPLTYQPLPAEHDPLPLTLLSPASNKLVNSIFGELDQPAPTLEMHPADAAARHLHSGMPVRVFNRYGEVHVALRVSKDVRPGVVALAKGLWRSSTGNGSTSTALVPDTLTDIGGGACYNDARVEVEAL
jgi:anaerobic selenocysteine-containing dehydrogenase